MIIDDGSESPIVIDNSVTVLKNHINSGKGYSLLKAFKFAINQGFSHAVTIDADSQHDPGVIPGFLEKDEQITIILGRRNFHDGMPLLRRISNVLTSFIISKLTGVKIEDSQCGYRRYKLNDLDFNLFNEAGFQFESEILIKSLKNGSSIDHIPIPTIYDNNLSAINNFKDTIKFIRLILRDIF